MKKLFRKIFLAKEIIARNGMVHFKRWRLIECPFFNIYIHRIYVRDKDKHLHDHPWSYFSFILKGEYIEETPEGLNTKYECSFGIKKSTDFHKIHTVVRPVTSLFITGPKKRVWGYDVDGTWVDFKTYRDAKHSN